MDKSIVEENLEVKTKSVILCFVGYYLPGYLGGGPIRTIANMVERLKDDCYFKIVTKDHDLGATKPYTEVELNSWNRVGSAQVRYSTDSASSFRSIVHLIRSTPHDVIYLNSLFDRSFSVKILCAARLGLLPRRSIVLAPRGELSAGALRLKSIRKNFYLTLGRWLGLFQRIIWHASSQFEADDISKRLGKDASVIRIAENIAVYSNNTRLIYQNRHSIDQSYGGPLKICFLSRISRMKNLDFAIKVLSKADFKIEFSIYGPREDRQYWSECEKLICTLPDNVSVTYHGSLPHEFVHSELEKHDLFLLPTCGENFGHVILEAWSAGLPVLISNRTPWRSLEAQELGWDLPLDRPEEFSRALSMYANYSTTERANLRMRCLEFARSRADLAETVERNIELFRAN